MSSLEELASKIAVIGARQSSIYKPLGNETVTDEHGHDVARMAMKEMRETHKLPLASVVYHTDRRLWEFSGNLDRSTVAASGIPSRVLRITGGR